MGGSTRNLERGTQRDHAVYSAHVWDGGGVCRWTALFGWWCVTLLGCASAPEGDLGFRIDFACGGERDRTQTVVLRIAEGACPLMGTPVYESRIARGATGQATSPGSLPAGSYAFEARALDPSGREVASTCQTVTLPSAEELTLSLDGGGPCGPTMVTSAGASTDGMRDASSGADVNSLDGALDGDAGASSASDASATMAPRLVLEQTRFLRGQAIPMRFVNVAKSQKPFVAVYRESEAEPLESFTVPFTPRASVVSGGHAFKALQVGDYVLRLVYRDNRVVDERAISVVDDRDADGTADPDDGCPEDPLKNAPLTCGCGKPDGDEDGDGAEDCVDGCPGDALKTAKGVCGCGFLESFYDRDNDGLSDCYDACPTDPSKVMHLQCGCGQPETDRDRDGTADCVDDCADDAGKSEPGKCGCGRPDSDADGDGLADCLDECPSDGGKVLKGACGCGVSDRDTDGDRFSDCLDVCPRDPSKTAAGLCGCGVADADSDGDGTVDCRDGCPKDAAKLTSGLCGCGLSDVDGDRDGVEDCHDACPRDPVKSQLGVCGCGKSDDQLDATGQVVCPLDPASCREILAKDPAAENGTYLIDPDGRGAAMPMQVSCDMKSGGWTVIARDDFQSGQTGWSGANGVSTPVDSASKCATAYGAMLGGYGLLGGGAETRKTFDLLGIPHTEAWVTMDYVVLDSWDAEDALVYVDGVQGYRKTFDSRATGQHVCGAKKLDQGPQKVDIKSAHTSRSLQVRVTSTLGSDASDESFGVDNVVVRVR